MVGLRRAASVIHFSLGLLLRLTYYCRILTRQSPHREQKAACSMRWGCYDAPTKGPRPSKPTANKIQNESKSKENPSKIQGATRCHFTEAWSARTSRSRA